MAAYLAAASALGQLRDVLDASWCSARRRTVLAGDSGADATVRRLLATDADLADLAHARPATLYELWEVRGPDRPSASRTRAGRAILAALAQAAAWAADPGTIAPRLNVGALLGHRADPMCMDVAWQVRCSCARAVQTHT